MAHKGSYDVMCGGSPLIVHFSVVSYVLVVSCRGEYTGEEIKLITLVLPSLNRIVCIYRLSVLFKCRGDYTGEE